VKLPTGDFKAVFRRIDSQLRAADGEQQDGRANQESFIARGCA
jgi:hypothetical protein